MAMQNYICTMCFRIHYVIRTTISLSSDQCDLGTVASLKAYKSFAPLVIMAFHLVGSGKTLEHLPPILKEEMLKQSQNLTNLAPFFELSIIQKRLPKHTVDWQLFH